MAGAAGLVGVAIGASAVLAFRISEHQQSAGQPPAVVPVLPPGVADVMAVLRSSAVVLDSADEVVKASPAAYVLGVVRNNRLLGDELLAMVRQVRRDGEIREAELVLPRGPMGARARSVWARVAPLSSSLVLLLIEDRTEAQRVDAVRRDFVANVSHELKTPVGGLALLAEALVDAADDPEAVRRFAGRMQREADRLTRLVQDVIELSRLQGHDPLEKPTLVSLDEVLVEAVDRSRLTAETRSIALVLGGEEGVSVVGDVRQLVTAVGNLVENAVRYGPEGSRVAVVVRKVEDPSGPIAEISVSDEGPGIAEQERDRIFERFYRVDAARSRDTGGTGLGLSIVKHVAAGHGGEATVWSDEHTGSTFTLRLPAATAPNGVSPPLSRPTTREEIA